ncbi:hypothetical protein D5086_028140, partial [Populus alba]
MLPNPKSIPILHYHQHTLHKSSSPSSTIIKQCCKLSRGELAIFGNSSLLLLLSSQTLEPF